MGIKYKNVKCYVLSQCTKVPEVCSSRNKVRDACYLQMCSDMTQVHGAQEDYLAKSMECGGKKSVYQNHIYQYEAIPGKNK